MAERFNTLRQTHAVIAMHIELLKMGKQLLDAVYAVGFVPGRSMLALVSTPAM